jgi:hypothetical protein
MVARSSSGGGGHGKGCRTELGWDDTRSVEGVTCVILLISLSHNVRNNMYNRVLAQLYLGIRLFVVDSSYSPKILPQNNLRISLKANVSDLFALNLDGSLF